MCLGFELRATGDDGIEGTDESTVAQWYVYENFAIFLGYGRVEIIKNLVWSLKFNLILIFNLPAYFCKKVNYWN